VSIIPYLQTAKLVIFFQWLCYVVGLTYLYLTYATILLFCLVRNEESKSG